MRITPKKRDGLLELEVEGRLDAYWADHFRAVARAAVREGHHQIVVNMAGVEYLSSAGLGALMECYKELQTIQGTFGIVQPSALVADVLRKTCLDRLLAGPEAAAEDAAPGPGQPEYVDLARASLQVYRPSAGASVVCRLVGRPGALGQCGFGEADCRTLTLPPGTFGVGLGAPGRGFADCRGRFGEFIAVGGTVAYLPTGEEDAPDYLISTELFVPELQTLHGVICAGEFSHLLRFACKPGSAMSLEEIVRQALRAVGAGLVGMVMVAEVDGLVGAGLRRSPTSGRPGTPVFAHPDIREWMTFTTERAHARGLAVVAGIATREDDAALNAFVRPLGKEPSPRGHFHAVAFAYRPLPKGPIDLPPTVRALFETGRPQGILHLLNDDRPIVGCGQSEFVLGACWASGISSVIPETY